MRTLYLERSTGEVRDGGWVDRLDLSERPDRIVVGTGPGSFAGVRAAIAFAQGYALGSGCEVLGLPSPCAVAAEVFAAHPEVTRLCVAGDARQGKTWLALFDGWRLAGDVFQVDRGEAVVAAVPAEYAVVSPDAARLGDYLAAAFGARYLGGVMPTAAGLEAYAAHAPEALAPEPRPIYLNPAVRTA